MVEADAEKTTAKEKKDDNNKLATSSSTTTTTVLKKGDIVDVTIHPLVLLSAADHYHRVARGTRKRVVGVLLGQILRGGNADISNSFAVPFEEDSRNPVRTVKFFVRCFALLFLLRSGSSVVVAFFFLPHLTHSHTHSCFFLFFSTYAFNRPYFISITTTWRICCTCSGRLVRKSG